MYISIPDGLAVSCRNTEVYWYVNILLLFVFFILNKSTVNNIAMYFLLLFFVSFCRCFHPHSHHAALFPLVQKVDFLFFLGKKVSKASEWCVCQGQKVCFFISNWESVLKGERL